MVGYCGSCGTPRQDGAGFCMNCGSALPENHACPTCGQVWPAGVPWPMESGPEHEAESPNMAEGAVPTMWRVGLYFAEDRRVYFDGSYWTETELKDDEHMSMPDAILTEFDPKEAGAVLLVGEDGVHGGSRAPMVGPEYIPNIDCGNCGYPVEGAGYHCVVCGTKNLGPEFNPAALNE